VIVLVAYLLFFSFILHIISFLAIFVLYQRRSLERVSIPSMKEDIETIHQSIQAFVDEMEAENEALYEKLIQHIKKKEVSLDEKVKAIIEQSLKDDQNSATRSNKHFQAEEKIASLPLPIQSSVESPSSKPSHPIVKSVEKPTEKRIDHLSPLPEESRDAKYQKAIELFQQGFTADKIAKVLQIGKGEANLIVNMIKKQRTTEKQP
jgi:hypothetical protein